MTEKRETLVVLSPGFAADEEDSTCLPERQVFLRALKNNNPGLHIVIFAFQYPFSKKEYSWNGMEVKSFAGKNRGKLYRIYCWSQVWKALQQTRKTNHVIGILSFWLGECALIGKQFAKRYHLKHFYWLLGQDARAGNRYYHLVKPTADSLIALSDFLAGEFYKNYRL